MKIYALPSPVGDNQGLLLIGIKWGEWKILHLSPF